MVFDNESVEGKYIPLLYTASDKEGEHAVLPSDATTYTFPAGSGVGEKEIYLLRDVVVLVPPPPPPTLPRTRTVRTYG